MLVGVLALLLASFFYFYHNRSQWNMVFSWFRRSEPISEAPVKEHVEDKTFAKPTSPASSHKRADSNSSSASTPKAKPQQPEVSVPTFSLEDDSEEEDLPPPQFPALNSAQRASVTRSHAVPKPASSSMPPPALAKATAARSLQPSPGLMAPPKLPALAGLRVPSTGPLPNRLPTGGSSSFLSPTATAPPAQKSRKVMLSPGHSPLDWAHLQRTSATLSGVPKLMRVTPSMLKEHNGRRGKPAWSSYQGKVYNITPYLPFHPGGEGELKRCAGKDGEKLFLDIHPWVNWDNMLGQCLVGIMVSENDPKADSEHIMESLD